MAFGLGACPWSSGTGPDNTTAHHNTSTTPSRAGTSSEAVSSTLSNATSLESTSSSTSSSPSSSSSIPSATWHAEVPQGGVEDINRVWVLSKTDVWAVGNRGMILHWNGTDASSVPSGTVEDLTGLWGVDATRVYACGTNGAFLEYDGLDWTVRTVTGAYSAAFVGVQASSPRDIWVVDAAALAFHFDGNTWTGHSLPLVSAADISASAADNIMVAGQALDYGYRVAAVARFNGLSWVLTTGELFGLDLRGIWVASPTFALADGYTLGTHGSESSRSSYWNGDEWRVNLVARSAGRVWADSLGNEWHVGSYYRYSSEGYVYSPSPWVVTPTFDGSIGQAVGAVHGANGSVWLGGTLGQLLEWTGSALERRTVAPPPKDCVDVHTSSASNIWVACGPHALHWNGTQWFVREVPIGNDSLAAIHSLGMNSTWAVSQAGSVVHHDGNGWTVMQDFPGSALTDVWASSESDVWVTAKAGSMVHWNGSVWSTQSPGVPSLSRVWGSSGSDVYAVGTGMVRTVLHFDGEMWSRVDPGWDEYYTLVAGQGSSNVWIAGPNTAVQWNGTTWVRRGFHGTPHGLAVGDDGVPVILMPSGRVMRWQGNAWISQYVPISWEPVAVDALHAADVTVAGRAIMRLR